MNSCRFMQLPSQPVAAWQWQDGGSSRGGRRDGSEYRFWRSALQQRGVGRRGVGAREMDGTIRPNADHWKW